MQEPTTTPAEETVPASSAAKPNRIELMDGIRGLAVILMVLHHLAYDLVYFLGAPLWLFTNPVFDTLHYLFAGLFIMLAGVSSRFSRSNWKRGFLTLAMAALVTLATVLIGEDIWFGILHFMATAMLFYALTGKLWEKLPAWVIPVLSVAGTILTAPLVNGVPTETPGLFMFGFCTPSFESADYFPLLPWIFVFLFGTWLGYYIKERRFPAWFYETKVPFLAAAGRHTLIIFLLHQPILYGIVQLILLLRR